jgi:hypothetical protein
MVAGKSALLRTKGPSHRFPSGRFFVEEGGNCLSGGEAIYFKLGRPGLI